MASIIGAVATFFLYWIPLLGPIGGGAVAGYLRGSNIKAGGITGAIAGFLAALPGTLVVLLFISIGVIGLAAEGDAGGAVAGGLFYTILLLLGIMYSMSMTTIGGIIGAGVTDRQDPSNHQAGTQKVSCSDDKLSASEGSPGGSYQDQGRLESTPQVVAPELEPVPPAQIPKAPSISIEYGEIEKHEPIGQGGDADVYRATTTVNDSVYELALKEPRMGGTIQTRVLEQFEHETRTWAKLDGHDHVVDVVDYGANPLPWIAMEYMDGGTLAERGGDLPFEQATWTALRIGDAIYHAHRHGVAHFDLKPANVLFRTVEDAWDVPKVADWGLSKLMLDHSKSVEGYSPRYAAPEQLDDEYGAPDQLTDVYGLGAVCYELFTGEPPFAGEPFKVIRKVADEQPAPPTAVDHSLPTELDEILLTALAKDKDDRYEDLLYLRDDLRGLYESL